jgi:hypothetical protein
MILSSGQKREKKVGVALLAGLVVTATGVAVDLSLIPFERGILIHQLLGDCIAGLVATLVCLAVMLRHEEVHFRVAMERAAIVAELNHHVRNAVFPLCLAVQKLGDQEANRIAADAVERINIALKETATDVFARRIEYGSPATLSRTELDKVA